MESLYLEMRDGIRLAVDIYFPEPASAGRKLPTLLHQTRYWRLPALRWPFSLFSNGLLGHEGNFVKELVKNGFVFVNVDCRGSGASFGSRAHPWTEDEVRDGAEVVNWIIRQDWSNGNVGGIGISYTGTSAEFLITNQHPAVKATMALFSLYDVYDDIACPGGIPHDGFVKAWGRANALLDKNVLPVEHPVAKLLVKGVKPVRGKKGKAALGSALESHKENLHVSETSEGVEFRDDQPENRIVESMDDFSPHKHQHKANASGAAVYSASGWMDGAYPHAAIKRFLNTDAPLNKLMLGPWDHGAKFHITPGKTRKTNLGALRDAIKYFDQYLKGYDTGIDTEPPVRYYTLQEEKWKTAETWPPPGTEPQRFYFRPGGLLGEKGLQPASETIRHDPENGTGSYTRWKGLLGQMTTGQLYPDRKFKDQRLLIFETEPLRSAVEVTGHPIVNLFLKTKESDGSFFLYLEDVTPGGEVFYVTEGLFRAIHRKISEDDPHYRDPVPYHSFLRADAQPLPPGMPAGLRFDMLPISYLFRKGHKIRIAISTSDKDNFRQICREGSEYELLMGGKMGSYVELPVMPR